MTKYYKMLKNVHVVVNSSDDSKEMTLNFWSGESYRNFEEVSLNMECLLKIGICREDINL
ncbi:hypothetical protein BTO30_00530 [Domibacillus antri]|uniref:Uncharacterized protein n=1 Tax=Domibacillus antri TaxID=1714264 RepID=A0A1Q8Q9D0_9BACI|nr:hypothetical protein BTO30_00530 [Domibacillus antri]